jgi:hypothetical protein
MQHLEDDLPFEKLLHQLQWFAVGESLLALLTNKTLCAILLSTRLSPNDSWNAQNWLSKVALGIQASTLKYPTPTGVMSCTKV